MSKRGPCKYCSWFYCGKICSSPEAKRLEISPSGREKLKYLYGNEVKQLSKQFNQYSHRFEEKIVWKGCFEGESDFSRKRIW